MNKRIIAIAIGLLIIFYYGLRRGFDQSLRGAFIATLEVKTHDVQTRRAKSLSWDSVDKGEHFQYYDSVMTHADASAKIAFTDGTNLEMGADTLVVLEPPQDQQSTLRFNLKQGTARVRLRKGEKFETKNKVIIAKEDTALKLSSDPKTSEEAMYVEENFSEDPAKVKLSQPAPVEINDLPEPQKIQGTKITKKPLIAPVIKLKYQIFNINGFHKIQEPGEISKLLASLLFSRALAREETQSPAKSTKPHVEWNSVPQVSTYEIEVSQNSDFKSIVVSKLTKNPSTDLELSKAGTYYWHVRAIDEDGHMGPYSETATFQVNITPVTKIVAALPTPTVPPAPTLTLAPAPTPPAPPQATVAPAVVVEPTPKPTPPAVKKTGAPDAQISQRNSKFVIDIAGSESFGSVFDSGGSILSRTMVNSSLGLNLGTRFKKFIVGVSGDIFYAGQLTPAANVQNQNTNGWGYVMGANLKWQPDKYSLVVSYFILGEYSLIAQTTLGQSSTYTQPTGYGLEPGYDFRPDCTVSIRLRDVTFYGWNLSGGSLTQLSYGLALTYHAW